MKGLRNVGTVREFLPTNSVRDTIETLISEEDMHPIIGREVELVTFAKILQRFSTCTFNEEKQREDSNWLYGGVAAPEAANQDCPLAVVVTGEGGIGRTRLLDSYIAMALRGGVRVMSGSLTMHDVEVQLPIYYNFVAMATYNNRCSAQHIIHYFFISLFEISIN